MGVVAIISTRQLITDSNKKNLNPNYSAIVDVVVVVVVVVRGGGTVVVAAAVSFRRWSYWYRLS